MSEVFYRDAVMESSPAEIGSGVISFSFASEYPVLRTATDGSHYREVLSHSAGDVNLGLFNREGVVLVNHDEGQEVGSIVKGSGRVDADKKSRAKGKITNRAWLHRAKVAPEAIAMSVGYIRLSLLSETPGDDGIPTRRFSWSPYEASLLTEGTAPADASVGIGRSSITEISNQKTRNMKNEHMTEIIALNKAIEHDFPHLAEEIKTATTRALLESNVTLDDHRKTLLKLTREHPRQNQMVEVSPWEIGMDRRDIKNFSFHRAILNFVKDNRFSGYELDVSQQVEKSTGQRAEGLLIPLDIMHGGDRGEYRRDYQATVFGSGGALVPTDLVIPPIELLRNRTACLRLGARMMGGLSGNVVFPRQTSSATVSSLAENDEVATTSATFDQLALSPHRTAASCKVSKQLIIQSTPDAELIVRDDLFMQTGITWDRLMINGSGTGSEPLGILNTTGIGSIVFGGSATWQKILAFETAISNQNADVPKMAWLTTPAVRGVWKGTAKALIGATTVSAMPLWENGDWRDDWNDGQVAGYRAAANLQMPGNLVLQGNFNDLIFAMFGGIDMVVDPFTLARRFQIQITINTLIDAGLRHPQSFCVSADGGNQ